MSKTALAFVLIYLAGLLASLSVDAAWAFYIYQLVYFLNPGERWWGAGLPEIPYSFITASALVGFVLLQWSRFKDHKVLEAPSLKWFWSIVAIYALCSLWAFNELRHQQALDGIFKLGVIMTLAIKVLDTPTKLRTALWVYVIGAAYIGWEAYNTGRTGMGRLEGIGMIDAPDSNAFSAALVPCVPILGYFFWRGSLGEKFAAFLCGAFIVNAIVLVNSRGSFLATVAAGIYFSLRIISNKGLSFGSRIAVMAFVCVGALGVLSLTDQVFWERMSTLLDDDEAASGASRMDMWRAAFIVASDYPFGLGAWGFQAVSNAYVVSETVNIGAGGKAVHSIWLQALTEVGWLGFSLFIGLIVSLFRTLSNIKKRYIGVADLDSYFQTIAIEAGLLGFLVAATFIDQFRAQILYWFVAFIATLDLISRRQTAETTN